jgi:hypothetical protein
MRLRTLATGLLIWTVGTAAIRLAGHSFLRPGRTLPAVVLYLASFVLMTLLVPRICRRLGWQSDLCEQLKGASLLILPTLILDPFSCAFFTTVFPNLDPDAAGVFGGWMLIFCGGAIAGAWRAR